MSGGEYKSRVYTDRPPYPDEIITAAMVARWAKYGIAFSVTSAEARYIGGLDAQREQCKSIFGGGFLLSERAAAERAAAERAAAERAAAHRWRLSDREKGIVAVLSGGKSGRKTDV